MNEFSLNIRRETTRLRDKPIHLVPKSRVSKSRVKNGEDLTMAKEKDNTNKTFLLRMDAETMEAVEKWAADEFRSVNGQLQWIIAEALKKSGRKKK